MNIGALDRLIIIEYPVTTRNSVGDSLVTWTTLASVYSTRTYPRSQENRSEGQQQGRITSTIPVEFIVWYRSDVDETMRVNDDGVYYNIMRVNYVGQRNEMLKLVTEKKI